MTAKIHAHPVTDSEVMAAAAHVEYVDRIALALTDADHLEAGRLLAEAVLACREYDPTDLGDFGRVIDALADRVAIVPVRGMKP